MLPSHIQHARYIDGNDVILQVSAPVPVPAPMSAPVSVPVPVPAPVSAPAAAPARGSGSVDGKVSLKVILEGCPVLSKLIVVLDASSLGLGALLQGIRQQRVSRCGYIIEVRGDDEESFTAVDKDSEFFDAIFAGKRTFRATVVRALTHQRNQTARPRVRCLPFGCTCLR